MFRSALFILALALAPLPLFAQAVTTAPPKPAAAAAPAPTVTTTPPAAAQSATTPTTTPATPTQPTAMPYKDPENTILLETSQGGPVVIQLRPDLAPKTVARIKELVRKKFYDGIIFHRVIDGFMAQTGDPKGDGTGGSGQHLAAEFSKEHHGRGAVSMARAADPDSADSQFFIVTADSGFLDGQYTIFGYVITGIENIDKLAKGSRANNGMVEHPDKIVSMRMAADAK
jgi:cyclophilin family peptidyl-prolyl cis-trans isomerase